MIMLADATTPSGLLVIAILVVIACAAGLFAVLWDWDPGELFRKKPTTRRVRTYAVLEREKDVASALGLDWQFWIGLRLTVTAILFILGILSGIWLLYVVAPVGGWMGVGFALGGRAQNRRLRRERAFIGQLRNLRDRMAISNQSLDTALQELGRNPGKDLTYVLAPLTRGGSVITNIVDVGTRSRSPVIEYACGVLIWARSRSLESLIDAIDHILIPVSEAQLAVQEECQVTLTQQRAVTFAMTTLMGFMFFVVIRVETFAAYYRTVLGNLVLAIVISIFAGLVWLLGFIVRTDGWTRWDLKQLAQEHERLSA